MDHALWSVGVKDLKGHHLIREQCTEELVAANEKLESQLSAPEPVFEDELEDTETASGYGSDVTCAQVERLEAVDHQAPKLAGGPVAGLSALEATHSVAMVAGFVKRQE